MKNFDLDTLDKGALAGQIETLHWLLEVDTFEDHDWENLSNILGLLEYMMLQLEKPE